MGTRIRTVPGLDYVPVPGSDPDLVFGVIRATLAGEPNTASGAIFRRLFPVAKPGNIDAPWPKPTCFRHDVLVTPWAPADYIDPQALCRAYDTQCWDGVKDLVIIMNFRFPDAVSVDGKPPMVSLHDAYELVRAYCHQKLVMERGLATVLAMHLPSRAGVDFSPPHIHSMSLARRAGIEGFGSFIPELCKDSARRLIESEWSAWRKAAGK